jgi:hypothetical protein
MQSQLQMRRTIARPTAKRSAKNYAAAVVTGNCRDLSPWPFQLDCFKAEKCPDGRQHYSTLMLAALMIGHNL